MEIELDLVLDAMALTMVLAVCELVLMIVDGKVAMVNVAHPKLKHQPDVVEIESLGGSPPLDQSVDHHATH